MPTTLKPDVKGPANAKAANQEKADAVGIAKTDERGRTVDVHGMRHSDIHLTMRTYNHLGLMDVVGAIESLPSFGGVPTPRETLRATGTDTVESSLTSTLTLATVKTSQKQSFSDNLGGVTTSAMESEKALNSQGKQGFFEERVNGFEPSTYSLGSYHSTN
jgi:hypothetical protein